jgi:hypothetical protein
MRVITETDTFSAIAVVSQWAFLILYVRCSFTASLQSSIFICLGLVLVHVDERDGVEDSRTGQQEMVVFFSVSQELQSLGGDGVGKPCFSKAGKLYTRFTQYTSRSSFEFDCVGFR